MRLNYSFALLWGGLSSILGYPFDAIQNAIPNRYIISLKAGVSGEAFLGHIKWVQDVHRRRGLMRRDILGVERTFDIGAFHAYAGSFDEETLLEIKAHDAVELVEPDTPVFPFEPAPFSTNASLRNGFEYRYDENGGLGTLAYAVDTGVWVDNPDFEGRAELGYYSSGIGTHVAGTIASKTWGVSKKAQIIGEGDRTKSEQGVMSDFMEGFSWAVNNITETPGRAAVSVINMSLGDPTNYAFNNLVHAASEQGILSVVAAGNAAVDVSRVSPAGTARAITVAVSAVNNTVWGFSNFGSGVDLYAPGVDVYSLSLEAGKDVALSGTSMASPHVAGLALYLKSVEPGLETVDAITARILELCKRDVIQGVPGSTPNFLAYNGVGV
ncbi:peptidase S8/S53 domain-containing protein [Colletotrichum phormii]|uniref:Peptidase S8/S53 domain-containing protein n=1 Tax=Colletotrichum phormii TaxID=359342 RepID=A0AAI9ZJL6_9PEZI|nr:peptidase S8/S53 domain-containing protein [Colletotrichum phormii]KAK1625805.1 peptidase S8/S53 domain-containing protein [Colletotrichum phormii]